MLSDGMPTLADTTVLDAFRRWAYLEAQLDPLYAVTGRLTPQRHPELPATAPRWKRRGGSMPARSASSSCTSPTPPFRSFGNEEINALANRL